MHHFLARLRFFFSKLRLKLVFLLAILAGSAFSAGLLGVFFYEVYFGDTSVLKKTTILARINEETLVYYRDGETRLGSFFSNQHRRYVTMEEIPRVVSQALVATEDRYFFEHKGVNPIAIAKAFMEGVSNFVRSKFTSLHFRGGSTITQQTVKNILDRRDYSLKRKFREAIAAMQLERLYSKKQILEFYLNQFHVTSNGNGIAIAARYYFNKDIQDLDLIEAAFIVGTLKAPSRFNPFIQYSAEARREARDRAMERKNFVLHQMYEVGYIDKETLQKSWQEPVPFNKGGFSTNEVALVSLIRSQLDKKEILDSINLESIDEINDAGYRIYTTIDAKMQEEAQLSMRRNLCKLEISLNGYQPQDAGLYKPLRDINLGDFEYAKVERIEEKDKKYTIFVDYGLAKGTIPHESITRFAKLLELPASIGLEKRIQQLMQQIKKDDILFTEILQYDSETHEVVAELWIRPRINGALVSLDKGNILTIVSGFEASGYNRAIFGKRQPGSVFKIMSYFAGLQLGWTILDRFPNVRNLFSYQNELYFPRPDHVSPYKDVSMLWAGSQSENLATIDLTARLTEKLDFEQFKKVLAAVGLEKKTLETDATFRRRIQEKIRIFPGHDGIREFAMREVVRNMLESADVIELDSKERESLMHFWWGRQYEAHIRRILASQKTNLNEEIEEDEEEEELQDELTPYERKFRFNLIQNNYQRLVQISQKLRADWERLDALMKQSSASRNKEELDSILKNFRVVSSTATNTPLLAYLDTNEEAKEKGLIQVPGRALSFFEASTLFAPHSEESWFDQRNEPLVKLNDILLDNKIRVGTLDRITERLESKFREIMFEVYDDPLKSFYFHHDFRIGLGLVYLKELTEEMGVFSRVDPVLSFPLGTNVMSVAEVAKVYQTFAEGKVYKFYDDGPPNQLNFIARIEDRDGNLLYEPIRTEHRIVSQEVVDQIQQVLYRVVTHGTGRRARGELFVLPKKDNPIRTELTDYEAQFADDIVYPENPIRIPSFGKTGTTNSYQTASYAGLIPYPTQDQIYLNTQNSYAVASYVGYDLNDPMRNGRLRISGAQGALPIWTDYGKKVINSPEYVQNLHVRALPSDTTEWPTVKPVNTNRYLVDLIKGRVIEREDGGDDWMQDEQYEKTNLDETGEEYFNEYILDTGVNAPLYLSPLSTEQRMFLPFKVVQKD